MKHLITTQNSETRKPNEYECHLNQTSLSLPASFIESLIPLGLVPLIPVMVSVVSHIAKESRIGIWKRSEIPTSI